MSNLHRIQWIDIHIRARKFPNCNTIAEEFCISRRQASRDIEYLRYSLNGPVEYSVEHNGYYYTDETYHLPSLLISKIDKEMLSYLADRYKHHGSEMSIRLAELFNKLSGGEKTPGEKKLSLPVYSISKKAMYILRSIESALEQKKKIEINYISAGNNITTRIIHPYILFTRSQKYYCAGYCEMRKEERVFLLTRIKKILLLHDTFIIPSWFDPQKYGEQYRFHSRYLYKADVVFNSHVDTSAFSISFNHYGSNEYQFSFLHSRELISQLVATGVTFRIKKPGWLKEKVQDYFTAIIDKHRIQ